MMFCVLNLFAECLVHGQATVVAVGGECRTKHDVVECFMQALEQADHACVGEFCKRSPEVVDILNVIQLCNNPTILSRQSSI